MKGVRLLFRLWKTAKAAGGGVSWSGHSMFSFLASASYAPLQSYLPSVIASHPHVHSVCSITLTSLGCPGLRDPNAKTVSMGVPANKYSVLPSLHGCIPIPCKVPSAASGFCYQ